jgi:DNA-binding NarL/FixJ family response regulator
MRSRGRTKWEFQGTVLIADDHELLRDGLMQALRRELNMARFVEAECFAEAIQHLERKDDVTLAIVDLMTDMPSPMGIARMRRLRPQTLIVVLSGSEEREDILGALAAGAHGYIVKTQQTDQLIDKLRYILSGEIYVPPILAELAPEPVLSAQDQDLADQPTQKALSSRQRQVLKCLVEGRSNKEIAQALNVAEGTVKQHLAALFRVLGASNRAHAAALGKPLIAEDKAKAQREMAGTAMARSRPSGGEDE